MSLRVGRWRRLWCRVWCRHGASYRERRDVGGVAVLHFVCADCGHAAPMVERTLEEHRAAVAAGRRGERAGAGRG